MKKIFKVGILAVLAMVMVVGCATTGTAPATPNPQVVNDIKAAAVLIGGGAKAFLPLAGPTGTAIDTGVGAFCMLTLSPSATAKDEVSYLAQVRGQLQSLSTTFKKFNTQQANEVVLAINSGWTLVSTAINNAGNNLPVAIAYLTAFENGICDGYNGTLQMKDSSAFWRQYGGRVQEMRVVAGVSRRMESLH